MTNDYRSSDGDEIGYKTHAYHKIYLKNFESAQSIKVEFKFDGVIPAGIYGYALVLTNKLISIGCDGQRMYNLT